MLSEQEIKEVIHDKIEKDEKTGERSGGSGHLGEVSYELQDFKTEEVDENHIRITYRYTVFVETEFTYNPDNPPHSYRKEKSFVIDPNNKNK